MWCLCGTGREVGREGGEGLRDGGGAAGEVDLLGAGFAGHAADLETVRARI